jgi:hypothetical protein
VTGLVGLLIVAALVLGAPPAEAQAQDRPTAAMDGQWHFAVAPYFWTSGIKGDVSVKGLPEIPIEKPFSDIWSDFHVGFLGHFEGRKDRWGFATDVMYMDLHAPVASNAPVVGALGLDAKPSPDKRQKNLDKAVEKLLKDFPPPTK